MDQEDRNDFFSREGIQRLLSDAELARLGTVDSTARLAEGEEYIDLEHLGRGVLRAQSLATPTPMRRVLPRSVVHRDTWQRVLSILSEYVRSARAGE